ncbi:MAG TPA: nucleotidyltransferase family protein, partial [Bryobacteraceae bacterium]|nr:nucleotidyltransferase family protein [Bryobacteraceae bacterium]
DRLIRLMSLSSSPVIVVLGHEAQRIRSGLKQAGTAEFVVNENYLRGQLSSLQCGLAAVPSGAEGVLFTLVDRPAVQPATVEAILGRFEQRSAAEKIVLPRAGGQNGHPVCVSRELIVEFLALPLGAQARDVIRRHAGATAYVDVEDTGILLDVNDPETYRRLVAGG